MRYARAQHQSKQKTAFVLPRQMVERMRAAARRNRRPLVAGLVLALDRFLGQRERAMALVVLALLSGLWDAPASGPQRRYDPTL
jgi:hypothetical protein